jgi:pilus assembly protein CpaB
VKRRSIALGGAIVFALLAVGIVWWYVSAVKEDASKDEELTAVLVASENIPARTSGEKIVEQGLVSRQQVPRGVVALGAVVDENQLRERVLTAAVAKGQQIVSSQLAAPAEASRAFEIKNGMRAVSVSVDRVAGVGGMIQAGDRVDVIATFEYDVINQGNVNLDAIVPDEELARVRQETGIDLAATRSAVSRLLLQQVEVLRVDPVDKQAAAAAPKSDDEDEDEQEAPNQPVVVLMVSPGDVERLVFAEEQGEITLALVPAEDRDTVATPGAVLVNEFVPRPQPVEQEAEVVQTSQSGN